MANQVQTRLVPPATKAGSTTSAGSRRMSGQSKVEDSTVAAAGEREGADHEQPAGRAAEARPVVAGHHESPLHAVQNLYGVQTVLRCAERRQGGRSRRCPHQPRRAPAGAAPSPHRGRDPRRGAEPARRGRPDAASVRGIAARVGVAPNAVYTYFPDKAAVVKALVERLLGEVDHDVFADRRRPWRDRVEALALELRARLLAHPGAVRLMIGGPMDGPHALALNERLLELLADAGLDPTDAARAAYLLIVYVFGSIAWRWPTSAAAAPLPPEPDRIAARQGAFAATPADALPAHARRPPPTMAGYISTEQYLWGLRRVLDGISPG